MERIKLSKNEKEVFWLAMNNKQLPPLGMPYEVYFACIFSLHQKGLVNARFDCNKIASMHRTQLGEAYLTLNPSLKNPVDWLRIAELVFMGVTAIATTLALFISCTLSTK